jgi:hypothetical protein
VHRPRWQWKLLLILSVALAFIFLIDDKWLPLIIVLVWMGAILISLARLRRQDSRR